MSTNRGLKADMIDFEKEWFASERMRERIHLAEHERMARLGRAGRRTTKRPGLGRWALAVIRRMRELGRVATAA